MSYTAIIIGSGQAGGPLAMAFANAGKKTALIEEAHIGGTCINEGCTPTKTMVASARVAHLTSRGKDYGIDLEKPFRMNMETVRNRKRNIVYSFRGGSQARLQKTENLDLFMAKARFVSAKEIEVVINDSGEVKRLSGELIFINTGCQPAPLSLPGAGELQVLDSTSIMELNRVPSHLIVIGGGYVGRLSISCLVLQRRQHEVTSTFIPGSLMYLERDGHCEAPLGITCLDPHSSFRVHELT